MFFSYRETTISAVFSDSHDRIVMASFAETEMVYPDPSFPAADPSSHVTAPAGETGSSHKYPALMNPERSAQCVSLVTSVSHAALLSAHPATIAAPFTIM